MGKFGVIAVLAAAVFSPCVAQADEFDRGMDTMWEVLWHQSGTPTRLVRWEQDLKVRVFGVNLAAHKPHTLQALQEAANEAGLKVTDVSDSPDAAGLANVSIEITPDDKLSENQPCETRLSYRTETAIDSVSMQMRNSDARRCAAHESMHVMGVRGHPAGHTVLSYFTTHHDGLLPLDKAMLRAWYSPRAHGGMTPFELLPILADELVAIAPDKARATQARDRFLARTIQQMQEFADGRGDVPAIVRRSGKSSDAGVRFGRMEVSYFLAIAYQQGVAVARDSRQALRWLQRAATLGSRTALASLAAAGATATAASR
ncbi:MAG TPA: SEL1-like repeat protein [Ramlibacter sp.]|nr:SEL1-like repeat protein [Ramlibacter sp.]